MADIEFLKDLARPLGAVVFKKMFGGWGIWADGLMFALVAEEVLYFKVDAESSPRFEALDLPRFTYTTKDGRRTVMSYAKAPEEVYDDPDVFAEWARAGIAAARRAAASAPAKKPKAPRKAAATRA